MRVSDITSSHSDPPSPGGGSGACSPEQSGDNSASVWLGRDNECS